MLKNLIIKLKNKLEYILDIFMLIMDLIGLLLIIPTALSVFIFGGYLIFAIAGTYLIPIEIGRISFAIIIIGFFIIGTTDNYQFKIIMKDKTKQGHV